MSELAWAAGLFDGEGSVFIPRSKVSVNVHMAITMTHRSTLERFADAVGQGEVKLRNRPTSTGTPVYYWRVSGPDAMIDVARKLYPYLSDTKRGAIDKSLADRAAYELVASTRGVLKRWPALI